jgi:hypothetical protein
MRALRHYQPGHRPYALSLDRLAAKVDRYRALSPNRSARDCVLGLLGHERLALHTYEPCSWHDPLSALARRGVPKAMLVP